MDKQQDSHKQQAPKQEPVVLIAQAQSMCRGEEMVSADGDKVVRRYSDGTVRTDLKGGPKPAHAE